MNQSMQVLTSRATDEWYTPPDIIERVRFVLGDIDLDPATSEVAQGWIKAHRYHTLDLAGFREDPAWDEATRKRELKRYSATQLARQPRWEGRTFLNSPFDNTPLWTQTLEDHFVLGYVPAAIQLCNSNLGYNWYEDLWRLHATCVLRERVRFVKPDGTPGGQSKQGQTLALYSKDRRVMDRFRMAFCDMGRIIPDNGGL